MDLVPDNKESMPRIFCIANQKGGVGKTTTAVHLAASFALAGKKTLLVDLDPQCNATTGLGIEPLANHPLLQEQPLQEFLQPSCFEGLSILPGCRNFQDVEVFEKGLPGRRELLRQHLDTDCVSYDAVFIDSPPSLGEVTQAALASSTEVIMPIQCEYYAMEGLSQMIQVIRGVMQSQPGRLAFGGILLTMFDPNFQLTHEVEREVRDFFGEIVFGTRIPRDVVFGESPSHGQSVLTYAPRSRGARAYIELCMEVLERD